LGDNFLAVSFEGRGVPGLSHEEPTEFLHFL
jgi:hypothetical protein